MGKWDAGVQTEMCKVGERCDEKVRERKCTVTWNASAIYDYPPDIRCPNGKY
jgi:hypothetical protein